MESTIVNEKNNNFPKLMQNGSYVFLMPNPTEGTIVAEIKDNPGSPLGIGAHLTKLFLADFEIFHGTINGLRNR